MMSDLKADVQSVISGWRCSPRIVASTNPTSEWFADVTLQDSSIVWRVIRERGSLTLTAAPEFAPSDEFDYDLLSHLVSGNEAGQALTAITSVGELLDRIPSLSESLQGLFSKGQWMTTREELLRLYRERDAIRFGRRSDDSG